MSFNERLQRIERQISTYMNPMAPLDQFTNINGEVTTVLESDMPDGWRDLSPEIQQKERRRLAYWGRWRKWYVPAELDDVAAQIAVNEEFPGITSPHDIAVPPHADAEIHRRIQSKLDEINADMAQRQGSAAADRRAPWLIDDPLIGPSPRIAGRYARQRNETIGAGQQWYGSEE